MTAPTNEQQRADVLAVMEDAARRIYVNAETQEDNDASDALLKARAAVAELIEADREYDEAEAGLSRNADGPLTKRIARLNAAVKRRSIALANVGAQS